MTTRWWKRLATVAPVAAVAAFAGAGNASAYGSADQPIAQVEISANCDNPDFGLCQEIGLSGVWAWAELDTAQGTADHGTMDYTAAFCEHTGAGGRPTQRRCVRTSGRGRMAHDREHG